MPEISFRPCRPEDADIAVPLIHSSGPAAFNYVFCDSAERQSQEFLRHAFVRGRSEFGYRQHCAAVIDGNVVGVGAVRDASQNLPFTFAAFRDIAGFYSPLAAARSITRGLRTERVIQPPKAGVGIIYHLAVAEGYRGRGIGQQMLEQLLEQMRAQQITTAALDVAATNPRARALYERMGFVPQQTLSAQLQSRFGHVVEHTYMTYPLAQRACSTPTGQS